MTFSVSTIGKTPNEINYAPKTGLFMIPEVVEYRGTGKKSLEKVIDLE